MDNTFPQAVFLDRDGTIGGTGHALLPDAFALYSFARQAIDALKSAGIRVFSFTNQPGIARGEATYEEVASQLLSFGFDGAYLCPHQDGDGCSCRKPLPGMLIQAASEWSLDLSACVVVGDSWRDILAAHAAGAKKILVMTGSGTYALQRLKDLNPEVRLNLIAENLEEAVEAILQGTL